MALSYPVFVRRQSSDTPVIVIRYSYSYTPTMLLSPRLALAALLAATGVSAVPQAQTTQVVATPTPTSSSGASSSPCNNSPSLCSRNYNNVTYLGAHDSPFLRDSSTDNSIAGNQYLNATRALDAGLRFLQAQVHDENGVLELCHTSCTLLDAGTLEDWLKGIGGWMDDNPNEVVTLLLVNSDDQTIDAFGKVYESAGLDKISYTPTTTEAATVEWPTLQNMIDQGTRLVSFVTNTDEPSTTYPYINAEFDFIFETSYEITEFSGFNCTLDRPSRFDATSEALAKNYMGLVNHFKYQSGIGAGILVTDVDNITTINNASTTLTGALGMHLEDCVSEWSGAATFVLIDFWNEADPLDAVDSTNNLDDITGRKEASADETGDGEGAGFSLRGDLGHGALVAFIIAGLLLV